MLSKLVGVSCNDPIVDGIGDDGLQGEDCKLLEEIIS